MDQAPVRNNMNDHDEPSAITRNDDLISIALRSDDSFDLDEIVRLTRAVSPLHGGPSTHSTLPSTVLSTFKDSNGTKPTSMGTSYPVEGKGKAVATYESSISATHGSGSEADAEKEHDFIGIGDWTGETPLKGATRARKLHTTRRSKHKKPVVIIQDHVPDHSTSKNEDHFIAENITSRYGNRETKYLRRRPTKTDHGDRLNLAEEGRIPRGSIDDTNSAVASSLSPRRRYILFALLVTAVFTLIGSTYGAHHTGKAQIAHTKSIIFSATVVLSLLTVISMVVAKRPLQEALLAGVFESLIGFVLVVEIHEFM
ncbi:unnamed protein product [Periconia digitata]|uniref:Uncharacterized protein n=1 Tax=Periconia digitata TaxID=1303443 RepID=A0A9W4UAL7_9PLEO|nr:unnamed protein product [Periconia digitata]